MRPRCCASTLDRSLSLTDDNAEQQARLAAVNATLGDKLRELETAVALATTGQWDAALALAASERGLQLTNRLLGQLGQLDAEELRLLNVREARAAWLRRMTIGAMALALLAAGTAAWMETRRQNATLRATQALNDELDDRVSRRTASLEQALALNRALTEEVHHRAGNGLTLVASFLSLQASELDGEAAEALEEARRRVVALASAQRRLRVDTTTGTADLVPYLKGILDDIRAAVGEEVGLHYEAANVEVIEPSGTAVSIGVIVGEMVTNAIKHAFPDHLRGRVTLRLSATPGAITVEVEDDGVGLGEAGQAGLGTRVLPALAELLGGTLHRGPASGDPRRPGTLGRLVLPVTPPLPLHQAAL